MFVGAEQASHALFVHRFVRTIGHQPQLLARGLEELDEAARTILGRPCDLSAEECERHIVSLLRRNGCSEEFRHVVMVRLCADGATEILFHETSLYDSFAMRMLHPKAIAVTLSSPLIGYHSSASIATTELHRAYAAQHGADVAITLNEAGQITAIDGAPAAIVVQGKIIFSPQTYDEPEYDAVIRTAYLQGRTVECRAILADELPQADELIYVDYRGITAISYYNGRRYTEIVAEHLARDIEANLSKI